MDAFDDSLGAPHRNSGTFDIFRVARPSPGCDFDKTRNDCALSRTKFVTCDGYSCEHFIVPELQ